MIVIADLCASLRASYIDGESTGLEQMRAEIETVVDEIRQAMSLLRRHL
jgi:hypothetical protein